MGRDLIQPSGPHLFNHTSMIFDDFHWYITPHLWTTTSADSATVTCVGDNGIAILTTGATDNFEICLSTTNALFTVTATKTMQAEASIQYAEQNVNQADVAFGFCSVFHSADVLADDTGIPSTNFSGFMIYKQQGETVWRCISSNGTTQILSKSTKTAGGTAYQKLTVCVTPVSATVAEVTFFVDDVPLYDAAITNRQFPIKHQYTYTSAAAMYAGLYVKADDGGGEVVNMDWIAIEKRR